MRPGVIGVVGELGVFVEVPCPLVDRVESATGISIEPVVPVQAAQVYAVDYPREA